MRNVQDGMYRPIGSQEIQKTKVEHVLLDTLCHLTPLVKKKYISICTFEGFPTFKMVWYGSDWYVLPEPGWPMTYALAWEVKLFLTS